MNWVNRDASVLVKSGKTNILLLYETILNLLPRVSIKSLEFCSAVAKYFGGKTQHFTHELINFARSPYDDIISYECNTLYRPLAENGAKSSSMAWDSSSTLHNFVEFSRCINYDDCGGFEADLALEDEDFGELDDMMIERFNRPFFVEMDGEVVAPRVTQSTLIQPASQQASQVNQPTQSQPATQGQHQPAQHSQQTGQRASQPGLQNAATSAGLQLEDLELEVAIERSMFEGAAQAAAQGSAQGTAQGTAQGAAQGSSQGSGFTLASEFVLPSGRVVRLAHPSSRVVRNAHGFGLVSVPPPQAAATGDSTTAAQNPQARSTGLRARRRRPPHSS